MSNISELQLEEFIKGVLEDDGPSDVVHIRRVADTCSIKNVSIEWAIYRLFEKGEIREYCCDEESGVYWYELSASTTP